MCADSSTNTNGTKKATDTTTEIATNRVNWPRIQFREKVLLNYGSPPLNCKIKY